MVITCKVYTCSLYKREYESVCVCITVCMYLSVYMSEIVNICM